MASTKVQRIMTQPINLIFRFLQSKARIQIWLYEQKDLRIEGRITGFDEYMNLVLDEAEEVSIKKNTRKPLGKKDFTQRRQHNPDDEHGQVISVSTLIFGHIDQLLSISKLTIRICYLLLGLYDDDRNQKV